MTFSGHDTFHCRLFWLKKGFDFIQKQDAFSEDSGVQLGVGKNMVNSIRFWLKAYGVIDDNRQVDPLYQRLLCDGGWDPYLENEGTLWLLHYKLCGLQHSSIYNMIFRKLRKIRPEFTKTHFVNMALEEYSNQSPNILGKDFSVFTRTYLDKKDNTKEDNLSGLLTELDLLKELGKNEAKDMVYHIENPNPDRIPLPVLLYCILENENYGDSISFNAFYSDEKGIGNLLVLTPEQLESKLLEIVNQYKGFSYTNDAGIKEFQIKKRQKANEILAAYYA